MLSVRSERCTADAETSTQLGVIQRTAGAALYWDGGGRVWALFHRGFMPTPRWGSAPLAKIPDACMVRVLTRILEVSWLSEPTIKQTIS
jgi:hypothetical protein